MIVPTSRREAGVGEKAIGLDALRNIRRDASNHDHLVPVVRSEWGKGIEVGRKGGMVTTGEAVLGREGH